MTKKGFNCQRFPMEIQGGKVRLNMKTRYRRRTKGTSRQAQALVLDWIQDTEGTRGSSTINMGTIIQFRMDKYKIETKQSSPISTTSDEGDQEDFDTLDAAI